MSTKRKQIKGQGARYTKFVEWSEEDNCFIGRCPKIMMGGVHGDDKRRVYAELSEAVEEMLSLIHDDGCNRLQTGEAGRRMCIERKPRRF